MAGQLIPSPELAPPRQHDTTPQQRITMWLDLVKSTEALYVAGLQHRTDGDWRAEYARRFDQRREYRLQQRIRRAEELAQPEGDDAS